MTVLNKKQMSEEDIKLNFITPAIQPGWSGITMETKITDGRINIKGNMVARSKPKYADYLLYLNGGKPIAVVEEKDNNHSVSYGLQQAMTYAQMMDLPFAYSSNGDAFYEHDFLTGQERQISIDQFPTQDELIARYYKEINGGNGFTDKEKKVVDQPYYSSQNTYPPRYYQRNAVNLTDEERKKTVFDYNMFEWTYPGGLAMNARRKYDEHPINRMQEIREDNEYLKKLMEQLDSEDNS